MQISFDMPGVDGWGLVQMTRTTQSVRRTRLDTRERARTPFPEKGEKLNSNDRNKMRLVLGLVGPMIVLISSSWWIVIVLCGVCRCLSSRVSGSV
mmetsp:Transcript_2577/g.4789  ORF Transcript_2577/g.4789 Transcript_2577/m.4789 type:complete len:95 (+) Transcript_2577:152-436(+)